MNRSLYVLLVLFSDGTFIQERRLNRRKKIRQGGKALEKQESKRNKDKIYLRCLKDGGGMTL